MKPSLEQPGAPASPNDRLTIAGFLAFNAIFRLLLIGQNGGEYTDGILQITQFERPDSFWPPLYTALVWAVRGLGFDAIPAGRLVSWAASVLLVLPLWATARAWAGRRAALFTLALYTVSPMALRWSVRVMTDMPFLLFFHLACAALLSFFAVGRGLPRQEGDLNRQQGGLPHQQEGLPRQTGGGESDTLAGQAPPYDLAVQARRLIWATVWAVLASLTRYQGLLLLPLVAWGLARAWRARTPGRGWAAGVQALWLALPAWLLYQHFGLHVQQVAERQGLGFWNTLLNYWNLFEMFVFIAPYAFTPPVFVFFLIGAIRGPADGPRKTAMPLRLLLLYVSLAILVAQSVFQSFLTRYLLPLLPLALVCAGAGMARMEAFFAAPAENGTRRPGARWAPQILVGVTLVWALGFALASFFLQRGAFSDIYVAGRFIREMNLPENTRVYSNESYKPEMNGIKLAFAAGRPVELIPDLPAAGAMAARMPREEILDLWEAGGLEERGVPRMPPGSIVAIHTVYGGIPNAQSFLVPLLRRRYRLQPIEGGYFEATLVPLLPDIMQEPGTHQNPLAWCFRYQPQHFQTQLFRVM